MTKDVIVDQFEILKNKMNNFLSERDWHKYHTPKNIAMSIAIEAAELMELFQWINPSANEILDDMTILDKVKDEIADILIYAISLGLSLNLDLFSCINEKMMRNNNRFPPKEG